MTPEKKSKLIVKAELGTRTIPVLEDPVPEYCEDGFGTWDPRKKSCLPCQYIPICFCRATDTEPLIAEIGMTKTTKDKTTAADPWSVSKDVNPFRRNSTNWVAINAVVEMARRGLESFTQASLAELVETMKYKPRPGNEFWWNQALKAYDPAYQDKPTTKKHKEFFGLIVCTGGKLEDRTFSLNKDKVLQILKKYGERT